MPSPGYANLVCLPVSWIDTVTSYELVRGPVSSPGIGSLSDATVGALLPSTTQGIWFLNRATGLVLLALLTLSLVLGVVASSRRVPTWWPLFLGNELHRRISVFSLAFLLVHIITAIVDSFVDIDVFDVFIPFLTAYRPLWLALGTLATDILLAVLLTTTVRSKLSEHQWRAVHALSYLMWPLALMHGLGIGTDTHLQAVLVFNAACVGIVVAAVVWRISTLDGLDIGARLLGVGATLVVTAGIAAWLFAGPLAPGWSEKAGTPPPPSANGAP